MREQNIYHWTAFIIPGFVLLVGVMIIYSLSIDIDPEKTYSLLPWMKLSGGVSAILIGISVGLLSYVVGMILWGLSYSRVSLALFWNHRWLKYWCSNKKSGDKKNSKALEPHYKERIREFRNKSAMINDERLDRDSIEALYPDTQEGYRRLQSLMIQIMEESRAFIGPRLSSEWEILGLLLSLSLVLLLLSISSLVVFLTNIILQNDGGVSFRIFIAFLCFLTMHLGAGVAYKYRNKLLGRDIAYGRLLILANQYKNNNVMK